MEDEQRSRVMDVFRGLGLLALLHVVLGWIATALFPVFLVVIGVAQLLYVLPAVWMAHRKKRTGIVQGMLIGAGLTLLLNAACFGIIAYIFS